MNRLLYNRIMSQQTLSTSHHGFSILHNTEQCMATLERRCLLLSTLYRKTFSPRLQGAPSQIWNRWLTDIILRCIKMVKMISPYQKLLKFWKVVFKTPIIQLKLTVLSVNHTDEHCNDSALVTHKCFYRICLIYGTCPN